MDFVSEFRQYISSVTTALGKPLDDSSYEIIDRGVPHKPAGLPFGKMGVYTFWYNGRFLKIGKAGPNSDARFRSQHYGFNAASTLAGSIMSDSEMLALGITEGDAGDWIKKNCRRIDILIDASVGIFALELVEGILHYVYEPKYEGFKTQR
ncbi:hypothetical protein LJC63_02910 [Ruminococcaceae bacterium OttesenSCG-928-L11]|nr:hypothetical protein [Ruminococcaceae bacterium OttesenSCG-928-L11]